MVERGQDWPKVFGLNQGGKCCLYAKMGIPVGGIGGQNFFGRDIIHLKMSVYSRTVVQKTRPYAE